MDDGQSTTGSGHVSLVGAGSMGRFGIGSSIASRQYANSSPSTFLWWWCVARHGGLAAAAWEDGGGGMVVAVGLYFIMVHSFK